MPDSQTFDLGDVLSITMGRLVSPRHIDGVYDILGFMTGESLFTHQLPRAARVCGPELLRQHPRLAEVKGPVDCDGWGQDEWMTWLDEQKLTFGFELAVRPLAAFEHIDPIEELCDMVGSEKVIVFPELPDA